MFCKYLSKLILLLVISAILNGCTSIPDLQNKIIAHAKEEENAQISLDLEFKRKCSNGKELYSLPREKIPSAIECASKIFDDEFVPHARYKSLALGIKKYLIDQSTEYSNKKISQKVFKSRVIGAWNTYNSEWLKRSNGEITEQTSKNKNFSNIALGAVAVVAIVGLVALASAGGGGGNSFVNNYDGNCPCPGDIAADGNRCGARSAYSRSGGTTPYCPIGRL